MTAAMEIKQQMPVNWCSLPYSGHTRQTGVSMVMPLTGTPAVRKPLGKVFYQPFGDLDIPVLLETVTTLLDGCVGDASTSDQPATIFRRLSLLRAPSGSSSSGPALSSLPPLVDAAAASASASSPPVPCFHSCGAAAAASVTSTPVASSQAPCPLALRVLDLRGIPAIDARAAVYLAACWAPDLRELLLPASMPVPVALLRRLVARCPHLERVALCLRKEDPPVELEDEADATVEASVPQPDFSGVEASAAVSEHTEHVHSQSPVASPPPETTSSPVISLEASSPSLTCGRNRHHRQPSAALQRAIDEAELWSPSQHRGLPFSGGVGGAFSSPRLVLPFSPLLACPHCRGMRLAPLVPPSPPLPLTNNAHKGEQRGCSCASTSGTTNSPLSTQGVLSHRHPRRLPTRSPLSSPPTPSSPWHSQRPVPAVQSITGDGGNPFRAASACVAITHENDAGGVVAAPPVGKRRQIRPGAAVTPFVGELLYLQRPWAWVLGGV